LMKKLILDALIEHGVNQLYIIGGDGTHRGADKLDLAARKRGIKMTVAGVPKTIDNDIGIIDRSFGFDTAINEARKAIASAVVEASCTPNGIGLVKLMGRHAGYIAALSVLASRDVDLCLIPEVSFPLEGEHGLLRHLEAVLKHKKYAVVVVAEGAGEDLVEGSGQTDESGNKVCPPISEFLQAAIAAHFKKIVRSLLFSSLHAQVLQKVGVSVKFHDPSYMIRSVPANAADSVYAQTLAQNAVHGAMAGYTGFTSGMINNRSVMLPISVVSATSPSYLNPQGRTWERVLGLTHQPHWKLPKKVRKIELAES